MQTKISVTLLLSFILILSVTSNVSLVFATEIFSDGQVGSTMETAGDFSAWTGTLTTGTLIVESNNPHHGNNNVKGTSQNGGYACLDKQNLASSNRMNVRAYYKFSLLPDSVTDRLELTLLGNAGITRYCRVILEWSGTDLYWGAAVNEGSEIRTLEATPSNPTIDTWYCVEIERDIDSDTFKVWVDGVLKLTVSTSLTEATTRCWAGVTGNLLGSNSVVYFDCVVIADAYIGPESEQQNLSFSLSETANITTSLGSQKNLMRSNIETTVSSTDLYGSKALFRSNTETTSSSVDLASVKTLQRVSGESTSVTTIFSSSKSLTAVFVEVSESIVAGATLLVIKSLSRVLGTSVAVTTIMESAKSITVMIVDLSESAAASASLLVLKSLSAVFSDSAVASAVLQATKTIHAFFEEFPESISITTILDSTSHLAASFLEFLESASISGVLYSILPVIPTSADDALALAAVALIFAIALPVTFWSIRRKQDD